MKRPTFAPVYVSLFPHLAGIANQHGYALAAHGSVQRDLDLVAIPWTDEATDADTLMTAIGDYLKVFSNTFGIGVHGPEEKPHGRRAWLLATGFGSAIDLSVMPRRVKLPACFGLDDCSTQSLATCTHREDCGKKANGYLASIGREGRK